MTIYRNMTNYNDTYLYYETQTEQGLRLKTVPAVWFCVNRLKRIRYELKYDRFNPQWISGRN